MILPFFPFHSVQVFDCFSDNFSGVLLFPYLNEFYVMIKRPMPFAIDGCKMICITESNIRKILQIT